MKKYNRTFTRIFTVSLAGIVSFTGCGLSVSAAAPSHKEEVIYAMLNSDGSVNGIYAVNSFSGGDITDYGTYHSVRNLTTTDAISVDGDKITFHTDADKIYYQGNMETKDIPWNISIIYMLDGKEYTAEKIAGKSGRLEMLISITENKNCPESFFQGYALQTAITLDSEKCTNITAADSTIANVGSDKQLSYIILPGKGKEINISADVKDFEMDAISINGMKLNLKLEMDESKITDKVSELREAVDELNSGAIDLNDGASGLKNGASGLKDGASDLNSGAASIYDGSVTLNNGAQALNAGVSTLNQGIADMQEALTALNGKSASLTDGSAQMLAGLQSLQASLTNVSVDAENLTALSESSLQIKGGIDSLTAGLQAMDSSIAGYYEQINAGLLNSMNLSSMEQYAGLNSTMSTALSGLSESSAATDTGLMQTLQQTAQLLDADAVYIQASDALINGIDNQLDAQNGALMSGMLALQSNYESFNSAVQSMTAALGSLGENMTSLKAGVDTLVSNYSALDSGINEYTNAVAQIVKAYSAIYNGSLDIAEGTSNLYSGTKSMVNGTKNMVDGTQNFMNGTQELYDGTTELYNGTTELYNGANELKDGTQELFDGSVTLQDGTKELTDGTGEFYSETENMDTEISDTINETIDELTGKDIETVSFVSEKNTNIESVLFVIKTPAVEIPEVVETAVEAVEEPGLLSKFINLFKKD